MGIIKKQRKQNIKKTTTKSKRINQKPKRNLTKRKPRFNPKPHCPKPDIPIKPMGKTSNSNDVKPNKKRVAGKRKVAANKRVTKRVTKKPKALAKCKVRMVLKGTIAPKRVGKGFPVPKPGNIKMAAQRKSGKGRLPIMTAPYNNVFKRYEAMKKREQ